MRNDSDGWLFLGNPLERQALKKLCSEWEHWSYQTSLEALQTGAYFLLCSGPILGEEITGAIFIRLGLPDAEVMFVYVQPQVRRCGLGAKLILQALDLLKTNYPRQESAIFEVRVSNQPASGLYVSLGMEQIAVRKRFYSDGEGALVFKLKVDRGLE